MEKQIENLSEKQTLMDTLTYKCKILMSLEDKLHNCLLEQHKNSEFMCMYKCNDGLKFDVKKHGKFLKNLKKAERELEELMILKKRQNELKKISPPEYEDVFVQIKIQMNVRKIDLKKRIKNLKIKIEQCENEPKRNIEYLTSLNECLENKINHLKINIEETNREISILDTQLKKLLGKNVANKGEHYERVFN